MKNIWILILISTLLMGCSGEPFNNLQERVEINRLLDNWHAAAAGADFESYFNCFADSAIFIGTDPTENWDIESFRLWSKPYFDRGKAWSFSAVERNIFLSEKGKIAWFDELLDTQMKICRGSGVLEKTDGNWKIRHYLLSMTIPNENTKAVVKIKAPIEDELLTKLKLK